MKIRYENKTTKAVGLIFVTDEDATILTSVGYYHCFEHDFMDDENGGDLVEVWRPCSLI